MLAQRDRYEFQYWANSLVNAQPKEGVEKKGADGGIDGIIRFIDDESEKVKRVIVSVKSGHVQRKDIADLKNARVREKAELALLITLEQPTKPMRDEAMADGTYDSGWWGRSFPRCQIITIEELLDGKEPDLPPMQATFKRAQSIRKASQHKAATLPGLE
jgi:site-specific DNA-methyltransferase (adenine-specific)